MQQASNVSAQASATSVKGRLIFSAHRRAEGKKPNRTNSLIYKPFCYFNKHLKVHTILFFYVSPQFFNLLIYSTGWKKRGEKPSTIGPPVDSVLMHKSLFTKWITVCKQSSLHQNMLGERERACWDELNAGNYSPRPCH